MCRSVSLCAALQQRNSQPPAFKVVCLNCVNFAMNHSTRNASDYELGSYVQGPEKQHRFQCIYILCHMYIDYVETMLNIKQTYITYLS